MATKAEKHHSIDAQLRLLAPGKVSEDDKLVEYDALLIDRFLDILQDLHGPNLREFVSPPIWVDSIDSIYRSVHSDF
jgi:phosphoenolpyruvate carboxylase